MNPDTIPEIALAWHREGKGAVLATVVETWGSAPRQPGAQLAISGAGEIMGSVSGGCVEGAVVHESLEALAEGTMRLLTYGVSDEDAFSAGLACGGTIRVLVEPVGAVLPEAVLSTITEARAARKPIGQGLSLDTGERRLLSPADAPERFRADRSGMDEGNTFVTIYNPPLRLMIIGAVHVAQALVPMARLAGLDPVVIDPRESFASPARFPGTPLLADWPDEALATLGLDARCAVVTLAHDPKIDDPAIIAALRSDALYLGSLGSTRTHAKRVERLTAAGFDAAQIARIHAPLGLNIGAASPAEIALSALAQIVAVLRRAG